MAGRLSSTIMEDREALRREAARERQERGAMSSILAGNGPQSRSQRASVPQQHAAAPSQGLFGAPVRVEQEDETSRLIKNVLGDYQNYSRLIQGSTFGPSAPTTQVSSSSQSHSQTLQSHNRRSQQAAPPPIETRPPRQSNGVLSPARGQSAHPKPKEPIPPQLSTANTNYSKPPMVTAAARKSHAADQGGAAQQRLTSDLKKGSSTQNLPNSKNSNNNNNNNRCAVADVNVSRLEEVLKEMKVPAIIPHIDDVERPRESKRKEERDTVDKHRGPGSLPAGQNKYAVISSPQVAELAASGEIPSFTGNPLLGTLPQLPIEPPPTALSPMHSPQGSFNNNHGHQMEQPANNPSVNNSRKPFDATDGVPRPPAAMVSGPSSASSSEDDDDDHESVSQEDSQDSDVEHNKSMRMNAIFDKSFANTEKFPERITPFGDTAGVPSMFPQQRVPQLQVQRPNSAEGRSIESPLSASDDTNAEESKASWSLATFMSGATPNSVASSVKSPVKSSPRRSPTSLDSTPHKLLPGRDGRQERNHRKRRQPEISQDSNKDSEPSSLEKRRAPNPLRSTRSSMTPDPASPLVKSNTKREATRVDRVSPLIQNHDSNGSLGAEGERRRERAEEIIKKRREETKSRQEELTTVKIPLSRLKRKPQHSNKCDNNALHTSSHKETHERSERLERPEVKAPEPPVNSTRETKEVTANPFRNNCDDRRADSPMSVDSISSNSSRRRQHSPEGDERRRKEDERQRKKDKRDKKVQDDGSKPSSALSDRDASAMKRENKKEEKRKVDDPTTATTVVRKIKEELSTKKDDRRSDRQANDASAVRVKDEKKESNSDAKSRDDKRRTDSRDAKYSKDRFQRGVMLSDAAERCEKESRILNGDLFMTEAKKLKHDGDRERSTNGQVKKYLESALCFMLGGHVMEVSNRAESIAQVIRMYQDTQALVRHITTQKLLKPPQGATQERLAILALRVQAALSHRIFLAVNRDKEFREKSSSALHDFLGLNIAKIASTDHPASNGTTASPAGSHSSASSGLHGVGRDNGVRQDSSSQSGGRPTVTLPANVLDMVQKMLQRYSHFHRAYELWNQSSTYINDWNNKEFFDAVASATTGGARVDFTISTSEFVKYVREAICRIERYTNVA